MARARTGASAAVTGGTAVHRSVVCVHAGAREGAHCARHEVGNMVAAGHDHLVTVGAPATTYGGGARGSRRDDGTEEEGEGG